MFDNISFEYPYVLLLILFFVFCSFFCKAKSATLLFPHLNMIKEANKTNDFIQVFLKYLVIVFSILALASPVKKEDTINIKNSGVNIIMDLDLSGSMRQRDLDRNNRAKTRFDVVKEIVRDFIQKRVSDNIGLVVFGDSVLLASPLSFDKQSQAQLVSYLEVGMVGKQTALLDSLASSINILKNNDAKSNIIILLSDGEDNKSTIPYDVIKRMIKKYSIKIYAVGIGNSNQYLLKDLANVSKGKSYTAYSKDDLELIYEDINKLEKSKIDNNKIILKKYLFFFPLFIASLALLLLIYLKNKE